MDEKQIIEGIKNLRPTTAVSYKEIATKLEPLFQAIGGLEFVKGSQTLSEADLPYNSWYSDAFAALCTDETLKYTSITPGSFDRACKCFSALSNLHRFIEFLYDLLRDIRVTLPQFYGFVNDEDARKLLFEENMWLMRFNSDKFVITVALKGNNGLELQDHEISYQNGEYQVDGAQYPNLESLIKKYPSSDACTGSPYMAASYKAHRSNYNYYDEGREIPFRNVWSEITSDVATYQHDFDVRLYNWLSIFNPSPKLQPLVLAYLPPYVRSGGWSHVCRLLRLCGKSFALPYNQLLSYALSRSKDLDAAVEYLCSIGADLNYREENSKYLLHTYASYPEQVRCLLKYPNIEVNIADEYGCTPVIKSVDNEKALEYFLNDPRTDVNANKQELLRTVISRCPQIEMVQKVIDRGFDLDKNNGKYYVQVLDYRKTLEDRIKGWKILVAAGIDINAIDDEQRTVLHTAVQEAADEEVLALLDLGANVEGNPKCSDSPLHLASARGDVNITQLLIARGADVNRVNSQGKKAEELAVFSTKKLFRKVAPPLGNFSFVGHQIEFGEQKEAIPARYFPELTVIGDYMYVQGGLYRHLYMHEDGDYYSGIPFMDFWKVSLGNCLKNSKDHLGQWEKIQLPPRDIHHHAYETGYTIHVGDEIWFPGFDDHWVKFNTVKNRFSRPEEFPVGFRREFADNLKNCKGYSVGANVLYPSTLGLYTVLPDGNLENINYQGEELQGSWSNNHAKIGNEIWLKNDRQHPIPMYCLDIQKATWYKVGEVGEGISGALVSVGKYLLSTALEEDTNEVKICVFDTESLNWTKHSIQLSAGTLVAAEKQSMYVHNGRLILFGGQTGPADVTNAMYSIDLTPLIGVKSLAMISASAVVANQDKLPKEAIENLPTDIKERMGFNNKN